MNQDFSNDELILFLLTIDKIGSTRLLESKGVSFVQIAYNLKELTRKGYVESFDNGDLSLTINGKQLLNSENKKMGRTGFSKFIVPAYEEKVAKVSINSLVLPETLIFKE